MAIRTIRVTRKAHRRDGKRIKKSTFLIKDRGKPGRTPMGQRWFKPGRSLGWDKDDPMDKRRRVAVRSRGGDNLAAARALNALANVTTDAETKRKARADASFLFKKHARA